MGNTDPGTTCMRVRGDDGELRPNTVGLAASPLLTVASTSDHQGFLRKFYEGGDDMVMIAKGFSKPEQTEVSP